MRDPLRTSISQFSSAAGLSQARAANVRAVEPAADLPGAQRGKLYMLVEVSGSGGGHPALYRRILDSAQRAFYETEGTVTTALQRALSNAHVELRRVNEALPEANWLAGMTCVALQGTDLTVGQVLPGLVIVSHPKTVDLIPPAAGHGDGLLGGADRPDIRFEHTEIEPGSTVILAEGRWLEHVRPEVLAAAATGETPAQVTDFLRQLAGQAELSALVIGIGSGDIPEVDDRLPASGAAAAATAGAAFGFPADEAGEVPAEPGEVVAPEPKPRRGLFGRRAKAAQPEPQPEAVLAAPLVYEDNFESAAPEPAELRQAEAEPIEVTRRSPWALVLALVIIPLLIAAVAFGIWWMRNRTQESEFQQALSGATTAIESVAGLQDDVAAQRLTAAKEFLDRAKAVKPNDSRLQPVLARYEENMNRVNHVTPLYGVVPLWSVNGEGHKLARVLAKEQSVYVLDAGTGEINRFDLSSLGDSVKPATEKPVIAKRQQVKDSDQVVSDLIDMTWVDAVSNQRSRLLSLDTNSALYAYDTSFGTVRLPVGGRELWGSPQLLASYNGNVYLVDPKANQIWRYKPGDKGFEGQPDRYFPEGKQPNLAGAQSVAIDGNIWLLFSDGRLLKFFGGEQKPFEMTGLAPQLSNPTAIVASAEGDQIYVADAGNGRIVEFNKSGQFQRQFRPAQGGDMLRDARSMYLDEAGGILYVVTEKGLYKANLPRGTANPAPAQQ